MSNPSTWLAGIGAAAVAVLLLASVRLRPDHRLRTGPSAAPPRRPVREPLRRARRPFRRPDSAEIARWCDALGRDVRSGTTLAAALRALDPPPGATALTAVREGLDHGLALRDALAVPAGSSDEQAVLTVLGACAEHGGPAARPLDRLATTLRRRAADAAERDVHSAQARLSAVVMTVLPGAVLVLLVATSGSVRAVAATPAGIAALLLGAAMNLLGWWWMQRIVRGERT